ncbi:MAG TPA: hypothetical protein VG759_25325, partial [Candidatus Angelobacter sp.]|nr:hypothetical protein [Candidatus Angelobacter sp.]
MTRTSNLASRICVYQSSSVFISLIFILLFAGFIQAQQPQEMQAYPQQQQPTQQQPTQQQQQEQQQPVDNGPLSADEIIQILQDNPDLLAEAKAEIVSKAEERGYTITEAEITDDRLFSQIRGDDRVRLAISDELKQRGFGAQEQQAGQPSAAGQRQGQTPNRNAPQTGARQGERKPGTPETENKYQPTEKDKAQKVDPYRNLPALKELYTQTQSITDPSKLERFGAALFRNSTATADKT